MEGPLRFRNFKNSFVPGPQFSIQKSHQFCSTMEFAKQNFHFPILSRNLYEKYSSVCFLFIFMNLEALLHMKSYETVCLLPTVNSLF
jgi:hypothetical protein